MALPPLALNPLAARMAAVTLLSLCAAAPLAAQVPIVQPGAPGEPSRQISVEEATDLASLQFSEADVTFIRDMIVHHQQALEMTALVDARSQREGVRTLAERIALSQADEIAVMEEWLSQRDLSLIGDAHGMHSPSEMMEGMVSEDDMAALEAAEGHDFDVRFLELMIRHHRGAVTMVETLLDQPGSAQDPVLFEFTSDVTEDQTSEVERMTVMLAGFSPDPRVNLAAGYQDAGEAAWNMERLTSLPKPPGFFDPQNPAGLPMSRLRAEDSEAGEGEEEDVVADGEAEQPMEGLAEAGRMEQQDGADEDDEAEPRPRLLDFANTDIAFAGDVLIAGNYHGFNSYDISMGAQPQLLSSVVCPGGQGDVSVVGNLLIMSVEQTRGRLDCGLQGVAEPVSEKRFRGIRIFDISDFTRPVQVGAVQTCRGSHTHTVVSGPDQGDNLYVYVSGTSPVRDEEELAGCVDESPYENPESALFRIDVIEIPMARPQDARIVNRPYVFADESSGVIAGLWEGGDHGPDTQETNETNHCHDITAYPEIGLAAGACSGNGILLDISDPVNPVRLDDVVDPGFAYWHSATFNNDGSKVVFTDEWGGGSRARCRAFDPRDWGANAVYDIVNGELQYRSHYKLPAPQSEQENCVAHNGSLIPVPGRDLFVQAWYQGGISVMDFTDSSNPVEIAFFDRGPIDEEELVMGGYWSVYWHEGFIYGTEIARGLDVLSLTPSEHLTENEILAATLAPIEGEFNPQLQQRHVWPAEPVVARAYLDQLRRGDAIPDDRDAALSGVLDQAERLLASGVNGNAGIVLELTSLSADFAREGALQSGAMRSRLLGLASTLEGIAARL